jgi:hypothetical protein
MNPRREAGTKLISGEESFILRDCYWIQPGGGFTQNKTFTLFTDTMNVSGVQSENQ